MSAVTEGESEGTVRFTYVTTLPFSQMESDNEQFNPSLRVSTVEETNMETVEEEKEGTEDMND